MEGAHGARSNEKNLDAEGYVVENARRIQHNLATLDAGHPRLGLPIRTFCCSAVITGTTGVRGTGAAMFAGEVGTVKTIAKSGGRPA